MRPYGLLLIIIAAILLEPVSAEHAKPAKVLIAGLQGPIALASAWLQTDPLTDPIVIPARAQDSQWSTRELRKFVRIYFPRSYEDLLTYDYMILAQIEVWIFSNKQQRMLYDAIYHGGLGGMQTRSVMSMHLGISKPWADSILSDAFPNDADAVVSMDYTLHSLPMRVVINTNPRVPPIFKPYKDLPGVEYSFTGAYGTNLAIPKPGAVITSYSVGPYPYAYPGEYPDPRFKSPGWIPHTMYWRYGNGTTWTHQDMFGQYWNTLYNPYAPDMILAELIFSTGRKLPQDVVAVHRLRTKFSGFKESKSFVYSLIDFVETFGANANPITRRMGEIATTVQEARQLYLDQQYEKSSLLMDQALEEVESLREEALRLKDRALFWIYLVEWLVVTGVSLLAGAALWTLMIRKRLYREVAVTRISAREI